MISGGDPFIVDGNVVRVVPGTRCQAPEPLPPPKPNVLPFRSAPALAPALGAFGWSLFAVSALDLLRQKLGIELRDKLPEEALATNPAPDREFRAPPQHSRDVAWYDHLLVNPLVDPLREIFPDDPARIVIKNEAAQDPPAGPAPAPKDTPPNEEAPPDEAAPPVPLARALAIRARRTLEGRQRALLAELDKLAGESAQNSGT